MAKPLVDEHTIRALVSKGKKTLEVLPNAIITDMARDLAQEHGIQFTQVGSLETQGAPLVTSSNRPKTTNENPQQVVAFGSDHGGFKLKEMLMKQAEGMGFRTLDVGTTNEDPCDYPDFAYAVAKAVSSGQAWRGVMIDGAGIGSCVVANKVVGIKAACCHNEFVARNAREHNDTNVLTLGSRVTGSEVCKEILRIWLETWFAGGRHKKRVEKIEEIEAHSLRK